MDNTAGTTADRPVGNEREIEPMPRVPARRDGRDERGASIVEYALMIALIAVVCIAGVAQFGQAIRDSDMKSISTSI
jgi:Flp pilus assembly pilin Flp